MVSAEHFSMGHVKSEWDIVAMTPSILITACIPILSATVIIMSLWLKYFFFTIYIATKIRGGEGCIDI